jgi:hypothetical protein
MAWIASVKRVGWSRNVPRPASVRWYQQPTYPNHGTRAVARLSIQAMDEFYALAHESGTPEPLGVSIFHGSGEDHDCFAIRPALYTGMRDRGVYAIWRDSSSSRRRCFSSAELCEWQERGWSRLERRDGYLVGTFGTANPPGRTPVPKHIRRKPHQEPIVASREPH